MASTLVQQYYSNMKKVKRQQESTGKAGKFQMFTEGELFTKPFLANDVDLAVSFWDDAYRRCCDEPTCFSNIRLTLSSLLAQCHDPVLHSQTLARMADVVVYGWNHPNGCAGIHELMQALEFLRNEQVIEHILQGIFSTGKTSLISVMQDALFHRQNKFLKEWTVIDERYWERTNTAEMIQRYREVRSGLRSNVLWTPRANELVGTNPAVNSCSPRSMARLRSLTRS